MGLEVIPLEPLYNAIKVYIKLLYKDASAPAPPKGNLQPEKSQRNEALRKRYAKGDTITQLARDFQLSPQRVFQIIRGKRK